MSFSEQLQAIQRQYLQSLPATLEQIDTLARELLNPTPDQAALETLTQVLHKLTGSAGTFGLPALSAQAAKLDRKLETIMRSGPGSAGFENECHQLRLELDALRQFSRLEHFSDSQAPVFEPLTKDESLIEEVWLLEDDVQLGTALIAHFEAFNFSARLFTTFSELTQAFAKEQPEVLVLDVLLGDEGRSIDYLQQSQLLKDASARLIFISVKDDFDVRLQAAGLGAEAYFVKPLDIPRLITRIEQVLARLHAPCERVLIVDDDELLARYYQQLLISAGMHAEILFKPEQIINHLEHDCPDVILMDLQMPGINGQNLAAVIRQYEQWVGLPIIYLSAEHDRHLQLIALSQGADDFLVKPVEDEHLITVVKSKVARSRQLLELMTKDSLTGLLKHSAIKEAVRREWGVAKRKGEVFCVAMLDIDHFKNVNDSFGHAIGDEVITSVATLLRKRLRNTDVLGRYGGEEFAVVMSNCGAAEAQQVLDDFRQRFQALKFSADKVLFSATISIGVTEYRPGMDIDADGLLVSADKALYEAKTTGRNRLVIR